MRLKYFILVLLAITGLSLLFVGQQAEVIKLAYQENFYNKAYKELLDRNRYLRYNLISLKSSSSLADKLLSEKSNFEIPKSSQVFTLSLSKEYNSAAEPDAGARGQNGVNFIQEGIIPGILKLQESWPIVLAKSYINKQAQAQEFNNK